MKKKYPLLVGIILFLNHSWACDLCSMYINLEPNDLRNSMGLNYRYRLFEAQRTQFSAVNSNEKHGVEEIVASPLSRIQEQYNSYDLWINHFIGSKWQVNANMTFVDNYFVEEDSVHFNIAGPGDLSLVVKHLLYNTKADDSNTVAVRWLVGGGVKLPTGKFNQTYTVVPTSAVKNNVVYGTPYEDLDPHMQAGTGSLDFLLVTEFLIRYQGIGLSSNVSYRINTKNSNGFRFANRLNTNLNAFYLFQKGKKAIAPNIGLSYEYSLRDRLNGDKYLNSGGLSLFTTYGTKLYLNDFALGFTYFNPITQNLNDNQFPNKRRITGDFTYYF